MAAPESPAARPIAYLINRYPAVSHSFIRREIVGVEAAGAKVERLSIRSAGADLPDPADVAERGRTTFVLAQGAGAIGRAALAMAIGRPKRFGKALLLAFRMAGAEPRRLVRHVAYLAEACWIARWAESRGVRHLHAHFGTNPATVARLVGRLSDLPWSFTTHGPDEFDDPRGLGLGGKVGDAAFAVAISSFGRSQLMRWSDPAHWPKIQVVRCGLDALFLDASGHDPPFAPELVCVGRLGAQKGLPMLIEAAATLARRGVPFHLRLVGDGELRGMIEAAIARHGLGDRITLAGACDAATVRRHLLAARAMVLPSFAEGLPVVIMEALALGRPVIASAIAGTPELVDDGCGWLVPAGAVQSLADAMADALAADPARLAEMGVEGRRRVLAMHDARANGAALLALIDEAGA